MAVDLSGSVLSMSDGDRVHALEPPEGRIRMILDTDTYNEIDDQYALAYALLAPERLSVEAVYAAPFMNDKSTGPGDGMRKSLEEIRRVFDRLGRDPDGMVFEGAEEWLSTSDGPVPSSAVDDLVTRATTGNAPLYVVGIGAPTNIASALLAAPEIAFKIVVVWLGGNPHTWPTARHFNLEQDPAASRVLFDSGVPLVHVPLLSVTENLRTTLPEIDRFVRPSGRLGAYLAQIFEDFFTHYFEGTFARSKELWDVAAVAWLINHRWTSHQLIHSPILTSELTWSHDSSRHLIREVTWLDRDAIFADLFRRLALHAAEPGG